MPIEDLLRLLKNVKRAGDGYLASCPAHDDDHASLSIAEKDDRILWRCFKGCSQLDVLRSFRALGFDPVKGDVSKRDDGPPEMVWPIVDPKTGEVIVEHRRRDPGKKIRWTGPGGKQIAFKDLGIKLVDLPLYRAHKVQPGDTVVICEGEKAADAAVRLGLVAVSTVTGAGSAPSAKALESLKGHRVILWPDNDDAGRQHMAKIAATLLKMGVECVTFDWKDAPEKGDAFDFEARGLKRDVVDAATAPKNARNGPRKISAGVKDAARELDRYAIGDRTDRVPFGIDSMDEWLGGGMPIRKTGIIGGPSGAGKTTVLLGIGYAAARVGQPVLLASPEMGIDELAERIIIRDSRMRRSLLHNPAKRDAAAEAHAIASNRILTEDLPLFVLDDPELTMLDVEEACEKIKGLRLLIIDYAQELADRADTGRRYIQVGDVARHSIVLAKRFNCAVLIASQVNVLTEKRKGKIVKSYSYRESNILREKAHLAMVFEVDRMTSETGQSIVTGARFICDKHRNGPPFVQDVSYRPDIFLIEDIKKSYEPADEGQAYLPYKD